MKNSPPILNSINLIFSPLFTMDDSSFFLQENDPLLGSSPHRGTIVPGDGDTLGGFPVKFLILAVRYHIFPAKALTRCLFKIALNFRTLIYLGT